MSTSFASLNAGFAVDLRDLTEFQKSVDQMRLDFGPTFNKVKPTFGAYMRYSAVLEFGWRDKRMARFHVRGGSVVSSDSGIPHIYPAIRNNAKAITEVLYDRVRKYVDVKLKRKGSESAHLKELEKAWGAALNDKPRRYAVERAPYQYGFHRRSIQGNAYELDSAKIREMRDRAKAQHRIKSGKARKLKEMDI